MRQQDIRPSVEVGVIAVLRGRQTPIPPHTSILDWIHGDFRRAIVGGENVGEM